MVKKHLSFFPVWALEHHFRTRDSAMWYYQTLVEATQNIMAVLAGLNRLYFTTFQFKRMQHFIAQMTIAHKTWQSGSKDSSKATYRLLVNN